MAASRLPVLSTVARLRLGGSTLTRPFVQGIRPVLAVKPSQVRLQASGVAVNRRPSGFQSVADVGLFRTTPLFSSRIVIPLDTEDVAFDSIFLRDACKCPHCVGASTSQKNFQTSDIPSHIRGAYIATKRQDGIEVAEIKWDADVPGYGSDHTSIIPLDLLRRTVEGDHRQRISHFQPTNRVFWDNKTMTNDNVFVDYADFANSDKSVHRALKQLESHGLVFLRNVPDCAESSDSASSMNAIVDRIGPIRSTFYGLTWDVRSVPEAINVAYTHQFLGLHMDLCYMDLTPQFQLLHSLRAKAPGGESIFSDSFLAAERMRATNPEMFATLVRFPITFHYYNAGQSYRQVRTTIELADSSNMTSPITVVNWSPPFQGPFGYETGKSDAGAREIRRFVEAAKVFDGLISDPENMFELRMNEGDCVLFDNRRVLHARRAFDISKGERWLKGAYMDRDVFASRLARLDEVYGK